MSKGMGRRRSMGLGHGTRSIVNFDKPKNFKGTFRKLVSYLSPFKVRISLSIIFAALSSVFAIFAPRILGSITSRLHENYKDITNGTPGAGVDFVFIKDTIIVLIILYVLSFLMNYLQGYMMTRTANRVTYNLRKDISKKLNKLPLKYFDKNTHGEVLSRITNDVDTVGSTLNQSITQLITSAVTIIGVLIMMISISISLSCLALLMLPIIYFFVRLVIKNSQMHFKSQQENLGHVNGHIEEMYSAHNIVKAYCGEDEVIKKFNEYNENLYNSAWKAQFLSGIMMPLMSFVGNLGYVSVCILGGILASKGRLKVGDIQAFIDYMRRFTSPITHTASVFNILQATVAAAERVFEFLDEEEEDEDIIDTKDILDINPEVEFKNVRFGYESEKITINDFTKKAYKGQRIAIVGPTGAGKTTIVKLLMRFYELSGGEILIDGHNIKEYARSDLRKIFGMVLQDAFLFQGSIMDNIRYGSFEKTDEEVIEAAKASYVDQFIRTLPGGYQMELSEEASNLSQGERQLLTIARAVLKNPKVLLLDEATSSVDTRTEGLIQKAMEEFMKGRTSFVIAHRLSTIKNADSIIYFEDGDIKEEGTHSSLIEKNGYYARMYNSQFSNVNS